VLRKLWKQMRWSLRTQVVVVLFAGYLLVLWQWREPWQFHGSIKERQSFGLISPDGGRILLTGLGHLSVQVAELGLFLEDDGAEMTLAVLRLHGNSLLKPSFIDDDTIVAIAELNLPSTGAPQYVIFKRRFPEWWWGHFYRPEVWLLPLCLGLIVWTIRKDRAVHA